MLATSVYVVSAAQPLGPAPAADGSSALPCGSLLYIATTATPASSAASISITGCAACAEETYTTGGGGLGGLGGGIGGLGGGDGGGGEYMATVAASTEGEMIGTDQLRVK